MRTPLRKGRNVVLPQICELEPRWLLTTSLSLGTPAFADFVQVQVVGRHIFYNDSVFDGYDPAASPADDAAIAFDKSPLLPGNLASFENYTSYSRGLNGVIVDIAGLPAVPNLADFQFTSCLDSEENWEPAAQPILAIRQGAGVNGSDRVTFTWPDNAVRNGWLKVSILATTHTGLKVPDEFSFGNAIGESGNDADARVNATDEIMARSNPATFLEPADITNHYDFNRDGFVNATDQIVARSNSTTIASSLPLLSLASVPPVMNSLDPDGFNPATDGYFSEYAPTIIKSNAGTLLMFLEGRTAIADASSRDIVMHRSFDNGATWSAAVVIYHETQNVQAGSVTPIVDAPSGMIILIFTRDRSSQYVMRSSDDGESWTNPEDITASVKYVNPSTPGGVDYGSRAFTIYDTGPGHGIQLTHGPFAGRLIVTANHRAEGWPAGYSWSNIIFSDDHGATWHLGGGLSYVGVPDLYSNEASIVELNNGDLYMNMRIQGGQQENGLNYRGSAISQDGGATWSRVKKELDLTTPSVQASMIRLNDRVIAFAAPNNPTNYTTAGRQQMTIWLSYDEAESWVKSNVIYYSYAGYSDMVVVGPDTILLAFNSGLEDAQNAWHQRVSLARFNLDWLETAQHREFEWNFNEQSPGTTIGPGFPSLVDDGQWDLRGKLQANPGSLSPYVAGQYGDSALDLTGGSDRVLLTPANVPALQLGASDSLAVEIDFRTLASSGVLIGSLPGQKGWSLEIEGGQVRFSVRDQNQTYSVSSVATVSDGNWHSVLARRDRLTGTLLLSVDGENSLPVIDPTGDIQSNAAMALGSYASGGSQLAVVVDRLRIVIG